MTYPYSWGQNVNLKDKNIFSNDSIDDSSPINTLISEFKGDFLRITFDKGEYILNGPLRIDKPVQLLLSNETVLKVNNSIGGILVFGSHFSISGGKMMCMNTNQSAYNEGFGILMAGVDSCSISNLTITDFPISGIIMIPDGNKGCGYNRIFNNKFISAENSGLKFLDKSAIMLGYSGSGYSHDYNVIENNAIEGNYAIHHGIALIGHGKNNLLKGNTISRCASYGITLYEIVSNAIDYTIVNNQVVGNQISMIGNKAVGESIKGMGIYLMKTSATIVRENTITNVLVNNGRDEPLPPGSIALNTSLNCIVQDNIVTNSGKYGLAAVYAKNLIIRNNQVSATGYQPIFICYSNDVSIKDNTLSSEGKEIVKLKFGNTNEVGLPKDAFKYEFYQQETGMNIKVDSNFINVNKAKNVIFLEGPASSSGALSLSVSNNILNMEGKEILQQGNYKGKIILKNNAFKANR